MNRRNSNKNRGLRNIVAAAVTAFMIGVTAISAEVGASAADTAAKIAVPQSAQVGESFTVTVTFTSDVNIGSVKARLDYDSSVIEFVSGEFASGAGGLCRINGWSETVGKSSSFELTFKAVGEGGSHIELEQSTVYSENGDLIGSPTGSAVISVQNHATVQTTTTAVTTQPEQTESETTASASQTAAEETSVATVTTTPAQTSATASDSGASDGSEQPAVTVTDAAQSEEEEAAVVTGGDNSSSPSADESSQAAQSDMKGAITAILLLVGCVAIACIMMTGDGKKKSSRSRRGR